MTNAMKRVLAKWPAIVAWYEERGRQAVRDRKPPPDFPLESHHTDLVHVLSILTPIADIKFKCQSERPEQVEHDKTGRHAVERLREVKDKIRSNLLSLLKSVAEPLEAAEKQADSAVTRLSRLEARFAPRTVRPAITSRVDRRAEDELDRWLEDPVGVQRNADMTPKESVLQFWKRLEESGEYRLIPKAVRVLFAIPSSSCQIERDFCVSGEMVSPQRTSLAGDSIDMCIFLNRNPKFVNLLQCEEIPRGQHKLYARPSLEFDIDLDDYLNDLDSDILAEFVSSTTLSSELLDDEEEKSSL
uniref:HAT C-terminal dimerisation domain-containing protein n=1 Tax=Phytophthora fragariae TaxID=53985 RepID=A0A6A3DI72_9STRA|nr:hypothetical protein PF009_g31412 [Phytophthora fragariae]